MGLPALVVPEATAEKIPELLKKEGIKVEVKNLGDSKDKFTMVEYLCTVDDLNKVQLSFGRPNFNCEILVIVIRMISPSKWSLKVDRTLRERIEAILKRNGATELPKEI